MLWALWSLCVYIAFASIGHSTQYRLLLLLFSVFPSPSRRAHFQEFSMRSIILLLFFLCGPFAIARHSLKYGRCMAHGTVCLCLYLPLRRLQPCGIYTTIYLLSAKINCVTSSIFVFVSFFIVDVLFVAVAVIVCSLSVSHFIHARLLAVCARQHVFVFAIRLY